jgi:hypothetical protein
MEKLENCNLINQSHVGKYVRLGGRGILDGLKGVPYKRDLEKIIAVTDEFIRLKAFRCHVTCLLPAYNFNQQVEIYASGEIKNFPEWL